MFSAKSGAGPLYPYSLTPAYINTSNTHAHTYTRVRAHTYTPANTYPYPTPPPPPYSTRARVHAHTNMSFRYLFQNLSQYNNVLIDTQSLALVWLESCTTYSNFYMDIYSHGFSVGYQNIHGLHDDAGCKASKLENELKNDIEIWSEIWGCECELSFNNYSYDTIKPQKHAGVTKGRKSGGFIILVRKEIENKFKIVKKSNNFVWIELSKHLIKNVMENFLLVAVYVSDVSSTYYNEEIFEELNKDTLNFCKDSTPVQVVGDFNGRTGLLKDIYEENGDFIPGPKGKTKFGDVPTRNNCDKTENSHGNKIINFCKTFDFIILNGRTEGDPIGNFTHLNVNNGPSTIDYALCNEKCNMLISNFLVLPMNEISDHSKIVTVFKYSCQGNLLTADLQYLWDRLLSATAVLPWSKETICLLSAKQMKTKETCIFVVCLSIHSSLSLLSRLSINTANYALMP